MSLVKKVGKRTLAVIMVFLVAGIAIGAVLVTSNTITINQHVNVTTTGTIRAELTTGIADVEASQQVIYTWAVNLNMDMKNVAAHVRATPTTIMDDLSTSGIFPTPSYLTMEGGAAIPLIWSEGSENPVPGWVDSWPMGVGDLTAGKYYGELALTYGAPGDYTVELYFTGETP